MVEALKNRGRMQNKPKGTVRTTRVMLEVPETKTVHITPSGRTAWSVRVGSSLRAKRILNSQKEAIKFVKSLPLQDVEVVMHDRTGMVDYIIDPHGKRY